MTGPSAPQSPTAVPTCYWHPNRTTQLRCTRCDRPICPDCMRTAAVGQHCVECVRAGARTVRQPRTQFGGRERSATPVVTYALIAINVLTFVLQISVRGLQSQLVLWPPAVADGQLYRLATSAFVHYGPPHLMLNMWALYVVGPPLEMLLGRLRFGALYALSLLGGSVLVYLLTLNTQTAGASGAVFRAFRRHICGGEAAQPRLALGCRGYRDQLALHFRCSRGQFSTDQLAGARGRAGHRRVGRRGLRLRAEELSEPDPIRGRRSASWLCSPS